jgi:hypothetical protein
LLSFGQLGAGLVAGTLLPATLGGVAGGYAAESGIVGSHGQTSQRCLSAFAQSARASGAAEAMP